MANSQQQIPEETLKLSIGIVHGYEYDSEMQPELREQVVSRKLGLFKANRMETLQTLLVRDVARALASKDAEIAERDKRIGHMEVLFNEIEETCDDLPTNIGNKNVAEAVEHIAMLAAQRTLQPTTDQ